MMNEDPVIVGPYQQGEATTSLNYLPFVKLPRGMRNPYTDVTLSVIGVNRSCRGYWLFEQNYVSHVNIRQHPTIAVREYDPARVFLNPGVYDCIYLVDSVNHPGSYYLVVWLACCEYSICTCDDYSKNNAFPCKHIFAVLFHRTQTCLLYRQNRDGNVRNIANAALSAEVLGENPFIKDRNYRYGPDEANIRFHQEIDAQSSFAEQQGIEYLRNILQLPQHVIGVRRFSTAHLLSLLPVDLENKNNTARQNIRNRIGRYRGIL